MGKATANEAEAPTGADPVAVSPGEPPRLRQYFPETMLWLPDAVTDPTGNLNLEFPVADSITTWRITALASSQDGQLGSATAPLRVFQDFFVDLDLPVSLTVGDEISIPVGVYNYLPDEQTVRLEIDNADWFELLDASEKQITIASNDITVVYFRIKALDFGTQPVKVTAWGIPQCPTRSKKKCVSIRMANKFTFPARTALMRKTPCFNPFRSHLTRSQEPKNFL